MPTRPSTHSAHDPADVTAQLRLLTEAPDQGAFFASLRRVLPSLLPDTRVDLFALGGLSLPLAGGAAASPPSTALRSTAAFTGWLRDQGYAAAAALELAAAGQHFGWMALARRAAPLEASDLGLAGQIAAMMALRLLYDQARDDLAERDRQAAHLERRLREHEELRVRATLALGAAHDIGNLLASIAGHAQTLQHDAHPAMRRDLRTILRAAGDGAFLLRRMLAARGPAGAAAGAATIALQPLVHEAIGLTQPFWERRPEIAIETALDPTPPVRAYAAEIREVLINLIINAIGAMPDGGTLTLRSFAADARVVVEVIDTGHGIAHERQHSIFQPFAGARAGGAGLGLSVSRAIVEGCGGTLTVRSAPGQGATFSIALPAALEMRPALREQARAVSS